LRPSQVERRTHDYTRHRTLSLFAALDAATGRVIGKCFARHQAREFRAFLNTIEAQVPPDLDVHIIMDNVSSHKTQAIRNWFAKRPRWQVHHTPTSASRISQVERFFANLTDKQIRSGVDRSTDELETAIKTYIDSANANPRPFVRTKSADDILASVKRFCLATLKTAEMQIAQTSESGY
jgi:transposase